jgi:hypothetical protein
MDTLPKIINQYPELLNITKPSIKNGIFYSEERYNPHFIDSLIQIYKFFFEIDPVLFVPKNYNINHKDCMVADLESLETLKENSGVIIFAYADILFNDILKINKRRLNTILKNYIKRSKVIILSITTLKSLELPILETFHLQELVKSDFLKNLTLNSLDFIDPDRETFQSNVESFVELINDFQDKRVYISLNLQVNELIFIESKLKEKGMDVFRREPIGSSSSFIVLNSCRTTQKILLKCDYDVFIFVLPQELEDLDILYYFKDVLPNSGQESCKDIYIDTLNYDNIENSLIAIGKTTFNRIHARDSRETFDTLDSIKIENVIFASEEYYRFNSPETICNMDLRNLTKRDYDTIRNYVKSKLIQKFNIDVKTCQLSTPCSPRDRSRKINSLSNKISSSDYRCDITCEIFKDFTIGVVVWSEIFTKREKINCLKNETYVYQTTSGNWRYTKVY